METYLSLIRLIELELSETARMVMEHRDDAVHRGVIAGVDRAAAELERLLAAGEIDGAEFAELRRLFTPGHVPPESVLRRLPLPSWLGIPGERASDVEGLHTAA